MNVSIQAGSSDIVRGLTTSLIVSAGNSPCPKPHCECKPVVHCPDCQCGAAMHRTESTSLSWHLGLIAIGVALGTFLSDYVTSWRARRGSTTASDSAAPTPEDDSGSMAVRAATLSSKTRVGGLASCLGVAVITTPNGDVYAEQVDGQCPDIAGFRPAAQRRPPPPGPGESICFRREPRGDVGAGWLEEVLGSGSWG